MEEKWTQEKEALQALLDYSPRLIRAMRAVCSELEGNQQADTEDYLLSIVNGMNWELQIVNGTRDYLDECKSELDRGQANDIIVRFNEIYKTHQDEQIARAFETEVIELFEQIEYAAGNALKA